MNSKENNSIIQMEKDELKNLVTEVRETIATVVNSEKASEKHLFSAADLWRIQRLRKTATGLSKKWENFH